MVRTLRIAAVTVLLVACAGGHAPDGAPPSAPAGSAAAPSGAAATGSGAAGSPSGSGSGSNAGGGGGGDVGGGASSAGASAGTGTSAGAGSNAAGAGAGAGGSGGDARAAKPFAKSGLEATSMIDDAITSKHAEIAKCVRAARERRKDPHAAVVVELGIDQEGSLIGTKTAKGQKADPPLLDCVRDALRDAPFPRSKAGVITVTRRFSDEVVYK